MSGASVELIEVSKAYRSSGVTTQALDSANLRIEPGSLIALRGPSGAGKSTILHLIGGMVYADSGHVLVDERDLGGMSSTERTQYRRTIGFVFQRFHLLPALTVTENIALPVLPRRQRFDVRARAHELAAEVGLRGRESALPSQLSGGEQQRVAVGRALMNEPRLLLADEPTGNLDSTTGAAIIDLVAELRTRLGMTVIVATHDDEVALRCDSEVYVRDGKLIGSPETEHSSSLQSQQPDMREPH